MGFVEAATSGPENIAAMVLHLGYPLYLVRILGTAKALGLLAIVTGFSPKLREWAYAGFVINLRVSRTGIDDRRSKAIRSGSASRLARDAGLFGTAG